MLHYHPKSLVTNHLFTMSSSYSILLMVKNQELGPQATIPCFFLQPSRYSNSFSIHSSPLAKLFLDLPSGFAKPQKSLRGGSASERPIAEKQTHPFSCGVFLWMQCCQSVSCTQSFAWTLTWSSTCSRSPKHVSITWLHIFLCRWMIEWEGWTKNNGIPRRKTLPTNQFHPGDGLFCLLFLFLLILWILWIL